MPLHAPFPSSFPPLRLGSGNVVMYAGNDRYATVNIKSPHMISYVDNISQTAGESVSIELPQIPVQQFIPQLLSPLHHSTHAKPCTLLTIDDSISQMRGKGFTLLTESNELVSTTSVHNPSNSCQKKRVRKREKRRIEHHQGESFVPDMMNSEVIVTGSDSKHCSHSSVSCNSSHTSSMNGTECGCLNKRKADALASTLHLSMNNHVEHATVGTQVDMSCEPKPLSLDISTQTLPTTASVEIQTDSYSPSQSGSQKCDLIEGNTEKDVGNSNDDTDNSEESNALKGEEHIDLSHCYLSISDVEEESDKTVSSPEKTPPVTLKQTPLNIMSVQHHLIPLGEDINVSLKSDSLSPKCIITSPTSSQHESNYGSDNTLQQLKSLELQLELLEHAADNVGKEFAASHKVIQVCLILINCFLDVTNN